MRAGDLHWASLADLDGLLARRAVSSVELTRALLARIAQHDPRIQSFIYVAGDDAFARAREADGRAARGARRGPLDGIPIALKDNYLTRSVPTTAGTSAPGIRFADDTDAACAERLRAAGCVLLGKTRTHEFAWGTTTEPTANPWDIDRIPGGSSGGSGAAVAAGFTALAMGSDTGGSVRIPASFCGVVGLKPTFGRISRYGIVPHSWSLDHPGPLTRTVGDAALALQVLAGYDARDPACQDQPVPDYRRDLDKGVRGLRVAVIDNHFMDRNTAPVQAAVDAAIAVLAADGAKVVRAQLPSLAYGLGAIFAVELASSGAYHDRSIAAGLSAGFQDDVRALVEMGRLVSAVDYLKAEQVRAWMMDEFRELFRRADVVVGPTEPITAWRRGRATIDIGGVQESVLSCSWRLTYPFNLTGLPALSLPCGFDTDGMPIGLQIAARPFDEPAVLRCAAFVERALDLQRRPPL